MPPNIQKRSGLNITAWILLVMGLVPYLDIVVMLIATQLGDCSGALGSGVTCNRLDLSSLLLMGELLFIFGIVLIWPVMLGSIFVGTIGIFRATKDGTLVRSPYPYVLIVGLMSLWLLVGGGIHTLTVLFG